MSTPTSTFERVQQVALGLAVIAVCSIGIPSCVSVQRGQTVRQLVLDATDLKEAMGKLAEDTHAATGTEVNFEELAPFLSATSEVKARKGVDELGNPWGPFIVGRPVRPGAATVQACSKFVKPADWTQLK